MWSSLRVIPCVKWNKPLGFVGFGIFSGKFVGLGLLSKKTKYVIEP